jgi:transcriptional regulator with XRE-family HTH domain
LVESEIIHAILFFGSEPDEKRARTGEMRYVNPVRPIDRHASCPADNTVTMAMKRTTSRTQDIDRHVGARVRERRIMLGLTQQQLADLIGVTYQQAHKYERGINRVSAGRLFEIAQVLGVPVSYFFDGIDTAEGRAVSPRERMCLELARNFAQIPNEKHQEALSQLARALAAQP